MRLSILLCFALTILGCASIARRRGLPLEHQVVRGQLQINSDFSLPSRDLLIDELAAQRERLAAKLGVEMDNEPIHVYLFDTEDRYRAFIAKEFPQFPERRAFFVESETQRAVYAHWSDHVAEDLRHEVAHGFLHAAAPRMPLWLDEGLAEYCEVGHDLEGMNRPHVELLCQLLDEGRWRPDLARLERFASVSDMTQTDYAESWAWAYWLLETSDGRRGLLRDYLQQIRSRGEPAPPLSEPVKRMDSNAEQSLVDFLQGARLAASG